MSKQQSRSAYKQAQLDLIDYLDRKIFSVHLVEPSRVTAHEIFCYSDGNQAKHHIRGSLRAAIHTGLSDPQMYLDVSREEFRTNARAHAISLALPRGSRRCTAGTCPKNRSPLIHSREIESLNNVNARGALNSDYTR